MAKAARGGGAQDKRKKQVKQPPGRQPAAPTKRAASSEFLSALSDMNAAQLGKVIERAEALRATKLDEERQTFVQDMRAKAASLGVTMKELLGEKQGKATKAKPGAKSRMSPPVKFRGPNAGETWTGRGRTPRWLVALEAEGRSRDEFAI